MVNSGNYLRSFKSRPLISQVLLLVGCLSLIPWFTTLIGQGLAETNDATHGTIGALWFILFLQLFVILAGSLVVLLDVVQIHRIQIAFFTAIVLVFALLAVQMHITTSPTMGAGWLLLAIVDFMWLLYFSADPASPLLSILHNNRPHQTHEIERDIEKRANPDSNDQLLPPNRNRYDAYRDSGSGSGSETIGFTIQSPESVPSSNALAVDPGSLDSGLPANSFDDAPSRPPNVDGSASSKRPSTMQTQNSIVYTQRALALYDYTASPDDPDELSFRKGDVLDIADIQPGRKWWEARSAAGVGIVPSNYMKLLPGSQAP